MLTNGIEVLRLCNGSAVVGAGQGLIGPVMEVAPGNHELISSCTPDPLVEPGVTK